MHLNLTLSPVSQPDKRCASNRDWIGEFEEHLRSESIPYAERRMMLSTAKQFIHWCEMHYPERFPAIFTDTYAQCDDAEIWSLRERFLREISPDRDLRHVERARLARFLSDLISMNQRTQ
ncbi:hypothetical protein EGT07_13405 [Herbaspirillum sp. HC18]|nr:hypothetical protein EGT07_13405 [Herbaspirillum sp. HC18]